MLIWGHTRMAMGQGCLRFEGYLHWAGNSTYVLHEDQRQSSDCFLHKGASLQPPASNAQSIHKGNRDRSNEIRPNKGSVHHLRACPARIEMQRKGVLWSGTTVDIQMVLGLTEHCSEESPSLQGQLFTNGHSLESLQAIHPSEILLCLPWAIIHTNWATSWGPMIVGGKWEWIAIDKECFPAWLMAAYTR